MLDVPSCSVSPDRYGACRRRGCILQALPLLRDHKTSRLRLRAHWRFCREKAGCFHLHIRRTAGTRRDSVEIYNSSVVYDLRIPEYLRYFNRPSAGHLSFAPLRQRLAGIRAPSGRATSVPWSHLALWSWARAGLTSCIGCTCTSRGSHMHKYVIRSIANSEVMPNTIGYRIAG
jgi:hypothetical protein